MSLSSLREMTRALATRRERAAAHLAAALAARGRLAQRAHAFRAQAATVAVPSDPLGMRATAAWQAGRFDAAARAEAEARAMAPRIEALRTEARTAVMREEAARLMLDRAIADARRQAAARLEDAPPPARRPQPGNAQSDLSPSSPRPPDSSEGGAVVSGVAGSSVGMA